MKNYRLTYRGAVRARLGSQKSELLVVELNDPIEADRLRSAVAAALPYHPRYGTRLGHVLGQPCLEPCEEKLPVIHYGDSTIIENYLWSCIYDDHRLIWCISDVLGNAAGMLPLIRDVLSLYLGAGTSDCDHEKTVSDPWTLSGVKSAKQPSDLPKLRDPEEFRRLYVRSKVSDNYVYQFEFRRDLIAKLAQSLKVSAASVITGIAAKATAESADLRGGYMNLGIDVDLRRFYPECAATETAFNMEVMLNYDIAGYRNQFFGYGALHIQRQLQKLIAREAVDYEVSRVRRMSGLASIATTAVTAVFRGDKDACRDAVIHYRHLGPVDLGEEVEAHVKSMYYTGQPGDRGQIELQVNDYADRTYVRVVQRTAGDALISAIEKELRESKIPYKLNIFPGCSGVEFAALDEELN